MMGQLMVIPTKDFEACFEQWKRCWENCVKIGRRGGWKCSSHLVTIKIKKKVPTLKGTEASLSYIQCFLYLLSSSINVSFT